MRELRQNASVYLARVAAGELIEITDRGRAVARLVPISDDPWQDLINAGEVIPGIDQESIRNRVPQKYDFSGSAALARLRSDER